jgi:hypothetical protein
MPINSLDHLMRKTTDGSIYSADWQFTTNRVCVAGRWNDTSLLNTAPGPVNTYPATNGALTWVNCNSSSEFAIPVGDDVDEANGFTKHIIFGSALTAVSTGVPAVLMLVDLQGYYPEISLTTNSPQTLSGTPSLRYATGDGLKIYPVVTAASDTTTPTLSLSYTNQGGTSGRSLSHTLTMLASAPVATLYHHGPTTSNFGAGAFLPLQNGDTGVQSIETVTLSAAGTQGSIALCVAKPLITIPIVTISNSVERDFVNQLTSLPRVQNGACLVWLYYSGAAAVINSNFYGSLEFVWG